MALGCCAPADEVALSSYYEAIIVNDDCQAQRNTGTSVRSTNFAASDED